MASETYRRLIEQAHQGVCGETISFTRKVEPSILQGRMKESEGVSARQNAGQAREKPETGQFFLQAKIGYPSNSAVSENGQGDAGRVLAALTEVTEGCMSWDDLEHVQEQVEMQGGSCLCLTVKLGTW